MHPPDRPSCCALDATAVCADGGTRDPDDANFDRLPGDTSPIGTALEPGKLIAAMVLPTLLRSQHVCRKVRVFGVQSRHLMDWIKGESCVL